MAISHGFEPWEVGDKVCVAEGEKEIACGSVIESGKRAAIVTLTKINDAIQIGTKVSLADAAVRSSFDRTQVDPLDWFDLRNISLGAMAKSSTFHFQQAFTPHMSLGFIPQYFNGTLGNVEASGVGAFGSLNIYPLDLYDGPFVLLAAGVYILNGADSLGNTDDTLAINGFGIVGYRWAFVTNVNVGMGIGAQYFYDLVFNSFDTGFNGILPVFYFDWGFYF